MDTKLPLTLRGRTIKLIGLGALVSLLLTLYTFSSTVTSTVSRFGFTAPTKNPESPCSPRAWADGSWTRKAELPTNLTRMTQSADALQFMGFQGCASSREFYWHLAADKEEQWDRFPGATAWDWTPSDDCDVRPLAREAMVRHLVEDGGWLLIGDSVTENHFFSLSCLLYPHVRATPNYTENPYFDRAWPQNLYLDPTSELIPYLSFPPGFNISTTPLVTFRRVDLLLEKDEIEDIYHEMHHPPPEFQLFSEEKYWSMSPKEYMQILYSPLPRANYGTLIVSTGGHWTTTLLGGLRNQTAPGHGIDAVLELFKESMVAWADEVQQTIWHSGDAMKQVIVRAYLPGHEDCQEHREPWKEYQPFRWNWYNWAFIKDFNAIFEVLAPPSPYRNIHYLSIDRPALLRPDAHATGDCLHIMTGAGVLEGWSHYIWHYLTRELPDRIR
ncbi:hypothetical protein OBBRIDRAFT_735813 [Obba rivulosa]|uniref:Uncharacterized protein n=1 Tax=Obba rivulosa TaxID=1052685 RepID=A0A8E2DI46_9APHY|nr:hypothetical protein OBBRIDRAFT_735813 [Obba rivulosa]